MPLYGQTITVNDPGLGLVEPAPTTPLVMGCSQSGTVTELVTCANKNAAITAFGQGPLTECICHILDVSGGPVHGVRLTGSVAGTASAVTPVLVGAATGTITVAGAPFDSYEVIIEITASGTLGTGEFMYSLDDGNTYSEELLIPAGATFAIPNTNLTLTFVPGAGADFYDDGDVHWFDCVAPMYAAADILAGVTALLALPATTEWAFIAMAGESTSAANAATLFAAYETHAATMTGAFRFCRWIVDAGSDTAAAVRTAMAAVSNARINVCYDRADTATGKAFGGWGQPSFPLVYNVAARAARELLSTDLGRVASGSLDGVTAIDHDEYVSQNLDNDKITTARTWPGRAGFYLTRGRLKCAAGSDFQDWQLGRIMDVACRRVYLTQQNFIGVGVRTNSDGTIDERDALRLETRGVEPLRADLTQPDNAEGTRGHVSALNYAIDRTNNVLTTSTIQSEVGIRPLGYARWITTQVGFDLTV
jgi:hypothetical protein